MKKWKDSALNNDDVQWCIDNEISRRDFVEFCQRCNLPQDEFSLKYFVFKRKQAIKREMESPFSTLDGYFVVWKYKSGAEGKIFTLSNQQSKLLRDRLLNEFKEVEWWKRVKGQMIRLA